MDKKCINSVSKLSHSRISIAVCTYNRADILAIALQSLCDQTVEDGLYEIIVVDNNSTDSTHRVVQNFCCSHPNMKYFLETEQGLSHARNRGWKEAKSEYVAYIDDDGKAPEQWLAVAMEIIDAFSPAAFGGPYFSFYNTKKPKWFKDDYGSRAPIDKARKLALNEYLYGSNMFFRRSVLEITGGFSTSLGMKGNKIGYGEETEVVKLIHETMPQELLYYDPRLFVYHLVLPKKMTISWILRERFAGGRYIYRTFSDGNMSSNKYLLLKKFARTLKRLATELIREIMRRDRQRYPFFQNYIYEHASNHVQTLGTIVEQYHHSCKSTGVKR